MVLCVCLKKASSTIEYISVDTLESIAAAFFSQIIKGKKMTELVGRDGGMDLCPIE